ncbi:MAG: hypothetical protein E7546_02585 [Ruminococcaceae bacterium]|nr:hypothetical protein [Oscillospiraceae bacterium]
MQNIMVLPVKSGLSVRTKQLITAFGGALLEFAIASLLHFLWEWSGELYPVAVFASVNESVWEHLKIMLWPYLIWSFAVYAILKTDPKRLVTARILGAIAIVFVTVSVFYIYSGIIGYSVPAIDISLALIALIIGELVSIRAINSPSITGEYYTIAVAALVLLTVMLLCFTVSAPQIGLFRDPSSGTYGI